ncbi:O-methyltransferase family protein [Mycolicibacterium hassiacum DSM 44199]|jgi:SAM-dependent methyltransferase|uniref:O-methyltransferase family protein n=1 Tax=Mycolicibacterium hassiacum (strain DSM 44199 / CIP 105218 / JCM 12690 / 3849) TaxID=1122247 RepID=K5BKP8_MYCHD|nr:class I SAM-dependent methyltransferase [Mycolicibacterium hassiacum]EKF25239.1 O-methyltransferase family protein [Mycolicibacterium hassiacum DSM 44199]MBX5487377.1 methyltransferase domain-containing protein [Mycolicibacterium hassiacum]MDA4088029.1 methyltransferase [Mycolicibacterium hassiacum DSM 44199]PZN14415.1 MAG: class I SAM-dependent methyltransferase [Mycolicibacterium hassiacum]VCT89191.1 putative S-adenosylmethionine-dependent methyltransferase [Mycolicibacterium hassiacum DS
MSANPPLPLANRSDADLPGHWLLARLGKRVLRPGGLELTRRLLAAAGVTGADVVELGPGLGRTATDIVAARPKSYVGVDDTAAATEAVRRIVEPVDGKVVVANAADTGLPDASADVVIGEAMLTMQGDRDKRAIVAEAFRVLRPGGRYAIHELGLQPDSLSQETKDQIRKDMARAIKVNARPLTASEWVTLLTDVGFEVVKVDYAKMALLNPGRVLADEGLSGALRIVGNLIRRPAARKRVINMRRTFQRYRHSLTAIAVVGVVPQK